MPFTDRYIKINSETDGVATIEMINPFLISRYREAIDFTDKTKPLSKTLIFFRDGGSLLADMYIYEFELLLNNIKHT